MYYVRRVAGKLHVELPPPNPLTAAEKAEVNANIAVWKAKFLAEFTALQVTERPVPADQNGFLLLHELGNSLPISPEFAGVLDDVEACDLEVAKRCLQEHEELVAKIERIGSLTTRSSSGMPSDYSGRIATNVHRKCADVLLLKSRMAAAGGDERESLRCVAAVGNLADHCSKIEKPSLLSETVCMVIDLTKQQVVMKSLLPALGKPADLVAWKAELARSDNTAGNLAHSVRGEWHIGADFMMLPLIAIGEKTAEFLDGEAITHCHAEWMNDLVVKLPSLAMADLEKAFMSGPKTGNLSGAGEEIALSMRVGLASWTKGYVRGAVVNAQTLAVLDLLILEKSGVLLSSRSAGEATLDPVTGLSFIFDATKREVSAPTSTQIESVKPIKLPW